jgi:hypothetical protein
MIVAVNRQADRASLPTRFVRDINVVAAHLSDANEQALKSKVVLFAWFGFWLDRTGSRHILSTLLGGSSLFPLSQARSIFVKGYYEFEGMY